ncbi:hypothetical protein J5N97_001865 [Dioscorea zingiberensis]|uniref:Uncharacterized protein n=1 Tax=Dioscorea zingiberensis TaxID=325984 RepID=A0A9D5BT44_9LILI|nr:hypothetical protein J5N97_001865 [Dioscorea zingiberensis]
MASAHEEGFGGGGSRRKPLGLIANAMKRKESFVQFFLMTGILMLSLRSLSQKYRIHDLTNDNSSLRQERDSLSLRMASIKDALLREASLDPSGLLSSHLRRLFAEDDSN